MRHPRNSVFPIRAFLALIQDSRILIPGNAYKRDIDDLRESPALRIIELLQGLCGAKVYYNDSYFP